MIGNKKIIAVCAARIQDEATNNYITALNDVVSRAGYGVIVYNTSTVLDMDNSADTRFYIYSLMDFSIIDVVIISQETIQNELVIQTIVQNAKNFDVPVIIIGGQRDDCISIRFDQEQGFEAMVRHMVEDHHMTDLHFMAGMRNNEFSDHRKEVFFKVMREHNLTADESVVSYGDFWSAPAEEATEKIIASGKLPQAIICANDKMAIAVCGVLNRHGIKIPEQVAVTGFDGVLEINFSSPRITSACCEAMDLAKKTLEVLTRINSLKGSAECFTVPARINMAESCGCKQKQPVDASRYLNSLNDRFYLYQHEAIQLSSVIANVQRCENAEQIVEQLRHHMFYDMCCVMEKDFLNEEMNPGEFAAERLQDINREMLVLFDCNHYDGFRPYPMSLKQIIPSIQYCLDTGRVIVLTALQHMGVPMGYVAFFFMRLNPTQGSRITQIANALNSALGGYRNMRYRNYLMNQIDEMSRIDTLTGMFNRRGFALAYQNLLEKEQDNLQLTIILADLDRLKYINDTFGHKEGDFAIRTVADALVAVCPEGSLFNRFGGDEMLGVCCGRLEPEDIRTAFTEYFSKFNSNSDKPYEVDASIGVYITSEQDRLSFEELIERSDRLMYEEKERHRQKLLNKQ
ncbi:MAG: GGDEF domain-containing protein [Lachnospiraceae bacterium]|nr:GGDEF domain-containing protein [Lachnospiraceae bacterium]